MQTYDEMSIFNEHIPSIYQFIELFLKTSNNKTKWFVSHIKIVLRIPMYTWLCIFKLSRMSQSFDWIMIVLCIFELENEIKQKLSDFIEGIRYWWTANIEHWKPWNKPWSDSHDYCLKFRWLMDFASQLSTSLFSWVSPTVKMKKGSHCRACK